MPTYIIAIGGTGAKFAEAVVHAAAAGLFIDEQNPDLTPESLEILFVDPDTGNGNLKATTTTIETYNNCYNLFKGNTGFPWLKTPIISSGNLSPCEDSAIRLSNYFQYSTQPKIYQNLIDVLYTPQERERDLNQGFAGKPSVGAAIMTGMKNREGWSKFINKIDTDVQGNRQVKIFLCGSIFGGTGASGFPTLGRLLADKLTEENWQEEVRLGGLLMLPYFSFPDDKKENQIHAKSAEFNIRTKAALEYYGVQQLGLDTVYLLGTSSRAKTGEFKLGSKAQRNEPHFLELLATTALRDFIFKNQLQPTGLLGRERGGIINWEDIPDKDEIRKKLANAAKLAFIWLTTIVPDIDHTLREKNLKRHFNYALKFFKNEADLKIEKDQLSQITKWCESYLVWLGKMQCYTGDEQINLFNKDTFLHSDPFTDPDIRRDSPQDYLKRERPPNNTVKLVHDLPEINLNNHVLDNLTDRNITEPKTKTIGLVKALYYAINNN